MKRPDQRSSEAAQYRALYNTTGWKRVRDRVLAATPFCERCERRGELKRATVVHHVEPHRGDLDKFYGGPFEALCKPCHDRDAQGEEKRGYTLDLDGDGWPADARHPANAVNTPPAPPPVTAPPADAFRCYYSVAGRMELGPVFDNAKAAALWCQSREHFARQVQHVRQGHGTVGGISYLAGKRTPHHRHGTYKTGEAMQVQTLASLELEQMEGKGGV